MMLFDRDEEERGVEVALLGKGSDSGLASRERRRRTVYVEIFVSSPKVFSKRSLGVIVKLYG